MELLLKIYRDSQRDLADKLFASLNTKGYRPTRERIEDIISTLKILYGTRFDSIEELEFSVTDGDDDGGVDAVVFTKNSLDIFEFKVTPKVSQKELKDFNNRFEFNFINKPYPLTEPESARLDEILKKWWSKKRPIINIYFVRPSFNPLKERQSREITRLESNDGVKVHFVDDEILRNKLFEEDYLEHTEIPKISTEPLRRVPAAGEKISEIILKVPIIYILSIYKKHIDARKNLFAQNVRIPKVSISFSETLKESVERYPDNFHLLHNGLVLVTENIYADGGSYHISRPQVVNGAQTIGSLFNSFKEDLNNKNLLQACVICKILSTSDEDEIQRICEATNTQKAVKVEDLRTNDLFQKQLEIYIQSSSQGKYFYNRKSGVKPKGTINISFVKLYQWSYSVFEGKPAEAKNARKELFNNDSRGKYVNINRKIEENIDSLLRLCQTALAVEGYIKDEDDKKKKSLMRSMNLHIISAMFLKDVSAKSEFKKCYSLLNRFYKDQKAADHDITPNKVFTKSEGAWLFLKEELGI